MNEEKEIRKKIIQILKEYFNRKEYFIHKTTENEGLFGHCLYYVKGFPFLFLFLKETESNSLAEYLKFYKDDKKLFFIQDEKYIIVIINEFLRKELNERWIIIENKLNKWFYFENYEQVKSFTKDLFEIIDKLNHHPILTLYYNTVHFQTFTHDVNSVTELDRNLALEVEKLYKTKYENNDIK